MHYGSRHTHSPNDRTIIKCGRCDWISPPMTRAEKSARGIPWYCDQCGARVTKFVTFGPHEEADAIKEIAVR